MNKEDAIRKIIEAAKEFQSNLAYKNVVFIAGHPNNPEILETIFLPRHFLHLTGIELNDKTPSKSVLFYNKCLDGRLSPNDFSIASNGTVEKKLNVILPLMNIHKTAKMTGDFNSTKTFLYTEKLAGTVSGCMGFVYADGYMNPNTLLNEDIRDVTNKPHNRVLAILRKPIKQEKYQELSYAAKGIHLDKIKLPSAVFDKIDIPVFSKN